MIHYDYEHQRWLCSNTSDARGCVEKHKGDYVYLYDIENGLMVNIRPYWTPTMTDTNKLQAIKNGKIQWKTNQTES